MKVRWEELAGSLRLPWPARFPDLSPIEYVWDELGRRARFRYAHPPFSFEELSRQLKKRRTLIKVDFIDLNDSIPERIRGCKQANKVHTRFPFANKCGFPIRIFSFTFFVTEYTRIIRWLTEKHTSHFTRMTVSFSSLITRQSLF